MIGMMLSGTVLMPVKWNLKRIMKERRWTNRALAAAIGKHETSISRLKNQDIMPQIDNDLLSSLCAVLECSPADLLEYVPDDN